MVATVLPFQKRKPRKPLAKDLVRRIRKMLREGKMVTAHPHVKERLLSRGITPMQMLTTIEEGTVVSGPYLDAYGDWNITLHRLAAGRKVRVAVAIKVDHFVVTNVT